MAWYLNNALSTMRNEVNAQWPNRDKASDGTIGDAAHQAGTSDHNPDSDGSVDAWDMDINLYGASAGKPSADLEFLKDRFERHEASKYWIHDRVIASRGDGWRRQAYTGANPHTQHIHWNTRSDYEDSTKPWGIEEDDMALTEAETAAAVWGTNAGPQTNYRVQAIFANRSTSAQPGNTETNQLAAKLASMEAKLDAIAAKVDIDATELQAIEDAAYAGAQAGAADVEAIADAVVEKLNHMGLTDEQIADVKTAVIEVEMYGTASGGAPSTT